LGTRRDGEALILGDSVMYGSALREHGVAAWRQESFGQALSQKLQSRGLQVLELSSDGLFPADMLALLQRYQGSGKAPMVLELNYRMFCPEAGNTATAYSRPFLAPDQVYPESAEDRLAGAFLLFRYCRLASHLLWQPSRAQVLAAQLGKVLPPAQAADEDAEDALLNMKIQPYYQAPLMDSGHAGLKALKDMALLLKKTGAPVLIFMTPQNRERIADVWDAQAWRRNNALAASLFKNQGLDYQDWSLRHLNQGHFLDHCHLDEAGNRELAAWVDAELASTRGMP
jgi:hypothetical protein